jgi:ribosomal protein L12E/L44/L45/RPP1/RPP2
MKALIALYGRHELPTFQRLSLTSPYTQPEKLQLLLNASRNDVESIWTVLFCKALEGKNVKEMLLNVGSGGSAAPVASGGAGAVPSGGVGGTAEDKAEEKKEEGMLYALV